MQESVTYQAIKQEGHQEGRQEGRQETLQEIAKNLLREGMALEVIARTTGLSLETLQQLQRSLTP